MVRIVARCLLIAGLLLAHAAAARAAELTPAERLSAMKKRVADAEEATVAADKEAQQRGAFDDARMFELRSAYHKEVEAARAEALEIATADPASAVAFEASEWLLRHGRLSDPTGVSAMELVTRHHAANPDLGPAVALVAYYQPMEKVPGQEQAVGLLRAVLKENPDRTVRGQAALGLALQAKKSLIWRQVEGKGEQALKELIAQFDGVIRDYGDCKNLRGRGARTGKKTLADEARGELFELQHLRVGCVAPEITGEDLDGKPMKLSDYRGKVVVVSFWASWCGPCMALVPHERALFERLKGKPFVLLGVNGDGEKAAAQAAVAKFQIPWRSFWSGPEGAGGAIPQAWNITYWPTVFVIDAQGVIRDVQLVFNEKVIDKLLEEMETAETSR